MDIVNCTASELRSGAYLTRRIGPVQHYGMRYSLLIIGFFIVFAARLWGQSLAQVTTETVPFRQSNELLAMEEFGGKLYGIDLGIFGETSQVYTLDLDSGERRYLPFSERIYFPEKIYYGRTSLAVAEDLLFARIGSPWQEYRLFHVGEREVTPLTPENVWVLTDPVAFDGAYYFLAASVRQRARYQHEVYLWKTDGTSGGTLAVTSLGTRITDYTAGYSENSYLIKGDESLFIAAADDTDIYTAWGVRLIEYRGEGEMTYVGTGDGSLSPDNLVVESRPPGNNGRRDNLSDIPIMYYDGYLYWLAVEDRAYSYAPVLYRVRAGEYEPEVVFSDWNWIGEDYRPVWGEFVQADDELILQLSDAGNHQVLVDLFGHPTGDANVIAGSTTQAAPLTAPMVVDGRVYFTAGHGGASSILALSLADFEVTSLGSIPNEWNGFSLAGGPVGYLLPNGAGLSVYRLQNGRVDSYPANYGYRGFVTEAGTLVYESTLSGYTEGFTYQLHVLTRESDGPQPLLREGDLLTRGVYSVVGFTADGDLSYWTYAEGGLQQLKIIEAGASTPTDLDLSALGGLSFSARHINGQVILRTTNYSTSTTQYYAILDGVAVPILDAASNAPLAVSIATDRSIEGEGITVLSNISSRPELSHYQIDGATYTRTVLATGLPAFESYNYWVDSDGKVAVNIYQYPDVDKLLIVDETNAALLVNRDQTSRYGGVVEMTEEGYWMALRDHLAAEYGLAFFAYGSQTGREIRFTGAPPPNVGDDFFTLGDQLLFASPNELTGRDWQIADASAGTVTSLPEANPGPGNGLVNGGVKIDGVVYYAGYEGDNTPPKLWRTDGTAAGTYRVADVDPSFAFLSGSNHYTITDTAFFFSAEGDRGHEVYALSLDGEEEVTLYADINDGAGDSRPQFLVATDDGLYVMARQGSTAADQVYLIRGRTVAIRDLAQLTELEVFPNPALDFLTVRVPEQENILSVEILDQMGRRVGTFGQANTHQLDVDVAGLPAGHYVLLTHLSDGRVGRNRITLVR